MKHITLISILTLLLLSNGISNATASPKDLVAFDRASIYQMRTKCDVNVIAKLDDVAVGLIESSDLSDAYELKVSVNLLEASADISDLWIDAVKYQPLGFEEILLETESFRLIRITNMQARSLIDAGHELVKCMPLDLPPDKPFDIPTEIRVKQSILSEIDSLMSLVSIDSITTYLTRLQAYHTRLSCTDSLWNAGDWIFDKFNAWNYDSVAFELFHIGGWNCDARNVVATKFGHEQPDKIIIMGGHYDSYSMDSDPFTIAPGVDDNATGTVMAMEIARVLKDYPFEKTVRFVPFSAEELGLIGSEYYVWQALERNEQIELMFNADMIGNEHQGDWEFYIKCNSGGSAYGEIMEQISAEGTPLIPIVQIGDFGSSDSWPFGQAGFRTIWSQEYEFSPHWHSVHDSIPNINIEYMTEIVRANLGTLVIAMSLPSPVAGLQALNMGNGQSVFLEWEPSADDDVIGYEVYAGTSESNIDIADTAYTAADTISSLQSDTTYYFAVSAFTADGTQSLIDEIVSCVPRIHPVTPDTLIVTPEPWQLRIQWTESPDLDLDHYNLYRKEGECGGFEFYREVRGEAEFIDSGLESNLKYFYYVTAVDSTGLESDPSNSDYAKIISLDSGILLVDETREMTGMPSDFEQFEFYIGISEGYEMILHEVAESGLLRINDLGAFSTVVWFDEDPSHNMLASADTALAKYLDFGGNLLYVGWCSMYSYHNSRPIVFEEGEFPYEYLGINRVDNTDARDFRGGIGMGGWNDLNVDTLRSWFNNYLGWVDIQELQEEPSIIYTFNSESGDPEFQDKPVGIAIEKDDYKAIYTSFPLYPMGEASAREFFVKAMSYFGEQTGVDDEEHSGVLPVLKLHQNYPNPFNANTTITFNLPQRSEVSLKVYNILGQEIARLMHGSLDAGSHSINWDASDYSSGIYFYNLSFNDENITKRMTLIK
ncbi:MAG: M28 family peptidase [candidate division Zixibacteria bacterium]|nr:M28 family peptidase [candidate division Zixibacteria bacterium]